MKTVIFLCLALLSTQALATHLRGGYIQTRSASNSALTYEVTVVIYANEISGTAASDQAQQITVCFGDGSTQPVVRIARIYSNDRSGSMSLYRIVHTYSGPGTYTISTNQPNRTGALNITGDDKAGSMTLTTTFTTNNGANQTPTIQIPENGFLAATNQRFVLPLNTTDADGDSLVYSLTRPLTSLSDNACTGRTVNTYQYPNDLTRRGVFTLDNRTGTLTWDAPVEQGNYSVAVTVSEYRAGIMISQTQLELSLVVIDRPGAPGVIPPYEPARETGFGIVTAVPDFRDEGVTLTVFPNPVDSRLQVVVQSSNPAPTTIRLTDANGRILHELAFKRPARQHEQVISLEGMTAGTYVLRADVNGRSLVRKVVKK